MGSRNKFRDSRDRINWAKRDFSYFKRNTKRYIESGVHAAVTELSPDGTEKLHKIKLTKPPPPVISQRVFSTLENLRASLDLATYAVGTLVGCASDKTAFPFCATASDFNNRVGGACKGFPKEILSLLESFKPYQGGDDTLWALNELCRGSKHRIIAAFGMVSGPVNISGIISGRAKFPVPQWNAEKDEVVYLITEPGVRTNYKVNISFTIAFREIEVVKGKPVQFVLDYLISKTAHIVDSIETICKRIRLI